MTIQNNQSNKVLKAQKRKLDRRIESVGWTLFLIWSGALLIVPDELFPEGSWLIGTGLIIILSMGIRYLYGIRIDGFWTVLGFLALSFGIAEYYELNLPVFPVLLIICGVVIVYSTFFRKISYRNEFWRHYWRRNDFWRGCWNSKDFRGCCWKGENDEKA